MINIANNDRITQFLLDMEKCAIFDYIGLNRHPIYPNITCYTKCMDALFDYVINNASILGYSEEQCKRFYDIERIDNRQFKILIQDKKRLATKIKDENKRAALYEKIVEMMQFKIESIKNEFVITKHN